MRKALCSSIEKCRLSQETDENLSKAPRLSAVSFLQSIPACPFNTSDSVSRMKPRQVAGCLELGEKVATEHGKGNAGQAVALRCVQRT